MTLYLLLVALGMFIYVAVAFIETAVSGLNGASAASALAFALFASPAILVMAFAFSYTKRLRQRSARPARASVWNSRIVVAAVFLASAVAILVADSHRVGDTVPCRWQCGAGGAPVPSHANGSALEGSHAASVDADAARAVAYGRVLFQERGCLGCHRPDETSVGPALQGLFGSPIEDTGCGVVFVDEWYLRDAILNPSTTVAVGFPPLMPTFAGQLNEAELQALLAYVKSLSVS